MGGTLLVVNSLISWKQENQEFITERILWVDIQLDEVYVININLDKFPYKRKLSNILDSVKQGDLYIDLNDKYKRFSSEDELTDAEKKIRDDTWNSIKNILDLKPQIFEKKNRTNIIKQAAEVYKVHENNIKRYLKRFWQRGMTKNALLPDYYLCGGAGNERKSGESKRGRKSNIKDVGLNVDEEIKKIFRIAINRYYYNSSKKTITLTYEHMVKDFFSKDYRIDNGVKKPIIKSENDIPTLNQFRYWFNKERNIKKEISTRLSAKKYEQIGRSIIGSSTKEALGPASIYQIDATIADIYICSSFNRNWIIGRPIIYNVMDVFSRVIVGIYIGLEGPSWLGAMMALVNTVKKKVEFCKEYDIEIKEEEWPVHYLPDAILADRGEFEGSSVDNLINGLGVKIMNTSPYRGDLKGIIEQQFNILNNQRIKPFLPGSVVPNSRERGDRDYRLDAKLNMKEFTQTIIRCVLYHNNHHLLKYYSREEMMIEDDVRSIPIELWNWGIKNRSGRLRYVDEDVVKLNLMPSDFATVTSKGIQFKSVFYASRDALKEKWFEKARRNGTWRIEVSYDPRNMNFLYIKKSSGTEYEKCFLLNHQSKFRDRTFDDIRYLLEYEKLTMQNGSMNELQAKVDLISDIESIVKEAEKTFKNEEDISKSKASKLKGIRDNREVEKMINRETERFEIGVTEMKGAAEVIHINSVKKVEEEILDDEMAILRRKQKEKLNGRIKKGNNS